ncbi:MAG TPA: glycosyltransferase family 2 protein [Longimicrobiales bacterium]|nr:glycosyltransferase family 2 protein [Longimicrobiales bacterium]
MAASEARESQDPRSGVDPLVSVVIPVRNGAATIGEQLQALSRQSFHGRWEVVVADNGSTDGTAEVAAQYRSSLPDLRIISAPDGLGINFARNAGVRAARGSLILICDADDVVQPGWIAAHVRTLDEYDLSGGPVDEVLLNTERVARFNAGNLPDRLPVCGAFLPYAIGCNLAFHREVWERIGGFDDAWQRGSTEIEFCWRAQLAGFTIGWAPDAVVAYRHSPYIRSEVQRRYRSARSMPRLFAAFRRHGMPRRSLRRAILAWAWLVYRAPWALTSDRWRMKWIQVGAWRAGLLAGSLRYRVLYL